MICGRCKGLVRVIRTVSAGEMGRASATRCLSCSARFVYVTIPYEEPLDYGTGVDAVAKKLRQGDIRLERDEQEKTPVREDPSR